VCSITILKRNIHKGVRALFGLNYERAEMVQWSKTSLIRGLRVLQMRCRNMYRVKKVIVFMFSDREIGTARMI
jgi:hypothetical protein